MPLDLKRLLIKRKSKESHNFVIHYVTSTQMEDVGCKETHNLYTLLRRDTLMTGRKQTESLSGKQLGRTITSHIPRKEVSRTSTTKGPILTDLKLFMEADEPVQDISERISEDDTVTKGDRSSKRPPPVLSRELTKKQAYFEADKALVGG